MKPPPSLRQYRDDNRGAQAPDEALVKYRSLRGLLARLLFFVPEAGSGIRVTQTNNGPLWSIAGTLTAPWTFNADGTISPGTVSYGTTIMPTMGGTRLDAGTPPTIADIGHTGSGTEYYYLRLSWGTTFTNGYLSAMSLAQGDVIIERHTSVPAATSSVKYIHLATFVNGVQTAAPVTASPLPVTLWDNGYLSTVLRVGQL